MIAVALGKRQAEGPLLPTRAPKQQRRMENGDGIHQKAGGKGFLASLASAKSWLASWTSNHPEPKPPLRSPKRLYAKPRRSSHGDLPSVNKRKDPTVRQSLLHTSDLQQDGYPLSRQRSAAAVIMGGSRKLPSQAEPGQLDVPTRPSTPPASNSLAPRPRPVNRTHTEIIDLVSEDESSPTSEQPCPRTESDATIPANTEKDEELERNVPHRTRKVAGGSKADTKWSALEHSQPPPKKSIANIRNWIDPTKPSVASDPASSSESSSLSGDRKPSFSSSSKASTSRSDFTPASSLTSFESKFNDLKLNRSSRSSVATSVGSKLTTTPKPGYKAAPPRTGPPLRAKVNRNGEKIRATSPRSQRSTLKEKPHILHDKHKATLAERRQRIFAKVKPMKEAAYLRSKKAGYKGTPAQFSELFKYITETSLHMGAKNEDEEVRLVEQALTDLVEDLQKINKQPLPPVYTPAIDQLEIKLRSRDQAIDDLTKPQYPTSLSPEDEVAVSRFLRTPGVVSKCAREQVTAQDLCRLGPSKWLNDEIINFYGAMLNERADNPKAKVTRGQVLNAYYFNSFFWSKLVNEGYERGRLAKWTKKVDIFSKDVILIPVNHNNTHWTAAAINFRKKRIESYDSLHMAGENVCETLHEYLEAEHLNKKKCRMNWTGWTHYVAKDNPQQQNGFDCGVFTCQTLEALSRGEETLSFTQDNMSYIRRRMIWEIGNATLRDGL